MAATKQPVRLLALLHAQGFVGIHEQPMGSNDGPQIRVWLRNVGVNFPAAWCAAFLWSMFKNAGRRLPIPGAAAVESWAKWAQASGDLVTRPFKGDVICFDWDRNDWYDHVGIVERVLALRTRNGRFSGWVQYIAGNDGDAVSRRRVWVNQPGGAQEIFLRIPG